MLDFFKNLFGKNNGDPEFSEEEYERHTEAKEEGLEKILGPMHEMVGHAVIPFQVGGSVDMYYFPDALAGTGFATMELIEPDGSGPKPNRLGTFELVAFTRHSIPLSELEPDEEELDDLGPDGEDSDGSDMERLDEDEDDWDEDEDEDEDENEDEEDWNEEEDNPYNRIERRLCGIFTNMAFYSHDEVLNPGDTCEVPVEDGENHCLVFDAYPDEDTPLVVGGRNHALLLCMEIFRSEMEYAMENGSADLFDKLEEAGFYPYSDLDREPVV